MSGQFEEISITQVKPCLQQGYILLMRQNKQIFKIYQQAQKIVVLSDNYTLKLSWEDFVDTYHKAQFYLISNREETVVDEQKDQDYYASWRK